MPEGLSWRRGHAAWQCLPPASSTDRGSSIPPLSALGKSDPRSSSIPSHGKTSNGITHRLSSHRRHETDQREQNDAAERQDDP